MTVKTLLANALIALSLTACAPSSGPSTADGSQLATASTAADAALGSSAAARRVLVGPSVLGLYGRWGIEAGVLWPGVQSLNGPQPEERYRAKFVFTYWF